MDTGCARDLVDNNDIAQRGSTRVQHAVREMQATGAETRSTYCILQQIVVFETKR